MARAEKPLQLILFNDESSITLIDINESIRERDSPWSSHDNVDEFIESDVKRVLQMTGVYFVAIGGVLAVASFVLPDIKTESYGVVNMWARGDSYLTGWLPTSNLLAYTLINIAGFAFVNQVTLRRDSMFKS
jgi:hypothetical protein